MNNLYELNRDKSRYSSVKDNLKQINTILSRTDLYDNISAASKSIRNNFLLNDSSKDEQINIIRNNIKQQRDVLNSIYTNINNKIKMINQQIDDIEL